MKRLAFVVLVCSSLMTVADATPVIFVVRHAEKATGGGEDPDLSLAGQKRADALARVLKDSEVTAVFVDRIQAHARNSGSDGERRTRRSDSYCGK